jgi:hypothetical protein
VSAWAILAKTGTNSNWHLQAPVSHLLSHVTEHVATRYGLVGAMIPKVVHPSLLLTAQAWPRFVLNIDTLIIRDVDLPYILVSRTGQLLDHPQERTRQHSKVDNSSSQYSKQLQTFQGRRHIALPSVLFNIRWPHPAFILQFIPSLPTSTTLGRSEGRMTFSTSQAQHMKNAGICFLRGHSFQNNG